MPQASAKLNGYNTLALPAQSHAKMTFTIVLLITLIAMETARAEKACSTQKVNGDCVVTIERHYPLTLPTIQMRPKTTIKVIVRNPFPFEILALNSQSAQGVAPSDQISGLLTAAIPNLKGLVLTTESNTTTLGLSAQGLGAKANEPPSVTTVKHDLQSLSGMLQQANTAIGVFSQKALVINLQLQEILSPVPRPLSAGKPVRDPQIPPETPDPWTHFSLWRAFLLCELDDDCNNANPEPQIQGAHVEGLVLQYSLPGAPTDKLVPSDKNMFDNDGFDQLVQNTLVDIQLLSSVDERNKYTGILTHVRLQKAELATYNTAVTGAVKDLGRI